MPISSHPQQSAGSRTPVTILYLDLDGFKEVNDSSGHETGDRLLVAWAQRLRAHFRPVDTIARLGGDEFCVLLEDILDAKQAAQIAERAKRHLEEPLTVDGCRISLGVSVGVGIRFPGEKRTVEQLLRAADAEMYRAKKSDRAYRKAS